MAKSTSSLASSTSSKISRGSSETTTDGTQTRRRSKFCGSWAAAAAAIPIDRRKRLAANARERKRMHLLNQAYDQLRRRLADAENKSKYDVLVQAKEYIQALAAICEAHDKQNGRATLHQSKSELQSSQTLQQQQQQQHQQPQPQPQMTAATSIKQEMVAAPTPAPTIFHGDHAPSPDPDTSGLSVASGGSPTHQSAADWCPGSQHLDSPLVGGCPSALPSWSSVSSPADHLQIAYQPEQSHHHQPPMAHSHHHPSIQLHNRLHQSLVAAAAAAAAATATTSHISHQLVQVSSYHQQHSHHNQFQYQSFKECPGFTPIATNQLF